MDSMNKAFKSHTSGFGVGNNETKSLHSYRGYTSKKFDTKSGAGKLTARNNESSLPNLRDNTVGPYTQREHHEETLSRSRMRSFNNALNTTVKQRYGAEKSVFSQKSKIMSIRASQKMPPSVFGRPTYRDLDGAKDIFRTVDHRKSERQHTIDVTDPLGTLVDEVVGEAGEAELPDTKEEAPAEENAGADDVAQDVIQEAEEKLESISNRLGEPSVFSKMSSKTYISVL